MTALFRLVEISSGSILIDGVDISKLGLTDVRSGLAIIPQDATLCKCLPSLEILVSILNVAPSLRYTPK